MKPRTANVVAKVLGWLTIAVFMALALVLTAPFIIVCLFDDHHPAKWEKARTEMGEICKALELHARGNGGTFPDDVREVSYVFPGGKLPVDPWTKQPFGYESDGRSFRLTCLGKDGKPGGLERHDQDIVFTEKGLR